MNLMLLGRSIMTGRTSLHNNFSRFINSYPSGGSGRGHVEAINKWVPGVDPTNPKGLFYDNWEAIRKNKND